LIVTYQKEQIPFIWDAVEPFIQRALDRGSIFTKQDIYDGLRHELFQLWTWQNPELKAVLITQLTVESCYMAVLSGSHMQEWLGVLPDIEEWAKSMGCKKMKIHGRKGWSRVLGYEITGKDELNLFICEKTL